MSYQVESRIHHYCRLFSYTKYTNFSKLKCKQSKMTFARVPKTCTSLDCDYKCTVFRLSKTFVCLLKKGPQSFVPTCDRDQKFVKDLPLHRILAPFILYSRRFKIIYKKSQFILCWIHFNILPNYFIRHNKWKEKDTKK